MLNTEQVQKTCEKHGEYTATIHTVMSKKIESNCPKCAEIQKAEDERQNLIDKKRINDDRIKKAHRDCQLPKRFADRTFESYIAKEKGQRYALKISKLYADKFEERLEIGGGMVMCGSPGTGKTHLAAAIANQVIESGRNVVFVSAMKALRRVKSTFGNNSIENEDDVIRSFRQPDLLIIDEVGVQYGSDAEKLILFEILNGRYEDMRPTIVLSNLEEDDLSTFLGARVVDRLYEGGGAVVPFTWGSYRRNRG